MAEVLERVLPFTDPQKAREAALKSVETRKQNGQELANLRLLLATKPIIQETVELPVQVDHGLKPSIAHTREQLEKLDELLADCTDPKSWDALTRAKERLFRIWAHLAGIPGPGQLKPTSPRTPRQPAPCLPIVAPVQAEPTTGSVQPAQVEPQEPKST